jgi:hypothetical protein
MRKHRILSATVLAVVILGRMAFFGGAVLADPTSSPSPSPSASPSDSPSPSPSDSPSPSASPSPSPTPTTGPTSKPGPTSTPGPTGQTGTDGQTGPQKSTGAGTTGTNGCTGEIPNWVFNTATSTWAAADKSSFSCDPTTGLYLSPEYYYNQESGWYEILPSGATPPSYMVTSPYVNTVFGQLQVGSPTYQAAQALGLLNPTDGIETSNTGAGSNNNASISNSNQNWFDLTNLVNVISTLQSNATTGNVTASGNTQVGDAVTGAANVLSDLINLLASAWSWSNGDLTFFMQNIGQMNSTTNGNIVLDPTQTTTGSGGQLGGCSASNSNTGANSNNSSTCSNNNGLNVDAQNTGNITNNVNVDAQSGNATASDNTSAGNVGSGNATAEVNIINLINSLISSGSSFFGVLNIFGNYNGDILFPNGFLNSVLGSGSAGTGTGDPSNTNTGANSNNNASSTTNNNTDVNNSSTNGVSNNIGLEAGSGTVTSDDNTTAGNASTGAASTSQSLFNLSNQSIFGTNAVLVIVNVLGHWVGTIMNLPGGSTTSALLTGNATESPNVSNSNTGANSNNNASSTTNSNTNVNASSAGTITNNVNVGANSGNATATDNTGVGNVSTGAATATASVANIFNSVLNVKNWFGVLIINVFGNWLGDVNQNSGAATGTPVPSPKTTTTTTNGPLVKVQTAGTTSGTGTGVTTNNGSGTQTTSNSSTAGSNVSSNTGNSVLGKVLAADTATGSPVGTSATSQNVMFILSAVVMLVAGALATIDKKFKKAKRQ